MLPHFGHSRLQELMILLEGPKCDIVTKLVAMLECRRNGRWTSLYCANASPSSVPHFHQTCQFLYTGKKNHTERKTGQVFELVESSNTMQATRMDFWLSEEPDTTRAVSLAAFFRVCRSLVRESKLFARTEVPRCTAILSPSHPVQCKNAPRVDARVARTVRCRTRTTPATDSIRAADAM